jgi:hypothetical protein
VLEWLRAPWARVGTGALLAALSALALLGLAISRADGFIPVLDHANLAFHEAGHHIYGILGQTANLYGGTLGQLTFPLVAAGVFLWRRHPLGVAAGLAWLFENLFNIARYCADARAQELPLVGGTEHDWYHILSRWHALSADLRVAHAMRTIGTLGLLAVAVWLGWRWWQDAEGARDASGG